MELTAKDLTVDMVGETITVKTGGVQATGELRGYTVGRHEVFEWQGSFHRATIRVVLPQDIEIDLQPHDRVVLHRLETADGG